MQTKHWTYQETHYLKENWGNLPISTIAERLKRSVNAIKIKAYKSGLRNMLRYGEYITLCEFWKILNVHYKPHDTKRLEDANFPISYQKIVTQKVKVIDMTRFWTWFKKNKHLIDLSKTDKGCFGYEPEWVDVKRQADKRAAEYKKTKWTESEDEYLIRLLKSYKYGYREISIKLKRTEGAIKRRMIDLKIKERPLKAEKRVWTEQQIKTVKEMYLKGYKSCIIAEFVPFSALAIQRILETNNYFRKEN